MTGTEARAGGQGPHLKAQAESRQCDLSYWFPCFCFLKSWDCRPTGHSPAAQIVCSSNCYRQLVSFQSGTISSLLGATLTFPPHLPSSDCRSCLHTSQSVPLVSDYLFGSYWFNLQALCLIPLPCSLVMVSSLLPVLAAMSSCCMHSYLSGNIRPSKIILSKTALVTMF